MDDREKYNAVKNKNREGREGGKKTKKGGGGKKAKV